MRFEVEWTYGGRTVVEAESEAEAYSAFHASFDMAAHYRDDCEGVDVVGVAPAQGSH